MSTTVTVGDAPTDPGGISGALYDGPPAAPTLVQSYPAPVRDGLGRYHQDIPATDLVTAGRYRFVWTTTGTAAGVVVKSFDVFDPLGPDTWPTRAQVAKYVPMRTLPADETSDIPGTDFGGLSTPNGEQVDDHIAAAVGWVAARCGAVGDTLWAQAAEVAAVRAAGMIELSYPVRDADVNTAQALLAQADQMLTGLCEANEDVSSDPSLPGHVLPQWSFPVPVAWGDTVGIW